MGSSLIALISIALLTISGPADETTIGQRQRPLTIAEAIELALRQAPSVLNQIQELKRNKGLVFQAQAALLPQVTSTGSYSQIEPTLTTGFIGRGFDLLAIPNNKQPASRDSAERNVESGWNSSEILGCASHYQYLEHEGADFPAAL
jgi:outer membrane protein TolC